MKKKLITAATTICTLFMVVIIIIGSVMASLAAVLSGGEEEEHKTADNDVYVENSPLSDTVLALKDEIENELKKYGKEEYVYLVLALVQQESGGQGEDIFQCSESLGKAPNSIDRKTSIEHGVKVICNLLNHEKIKVSSPQDIDHIKIALQAYNYGGGYITYINDTSGFGRDTTKEQISNVGKWTQSNALAYQKKMSAQLNGGTAKKRSGSSAEILGPYAYGDAYYTTHVLRYYLSDDTGGVTEVKAGEAAKIKYEDKQKFIWNGTVLPSSQDAVKKYLTTIEVKIYDENGKSTTMKLTVHKKLAGEFKAVFDDMYKIKFRIKASQTAAYVWKTIIGTGTVSQHSYGLAIDINWNDNPCFYNINTDVSNGYGGYQPGKNQYSVTKEVISIWKAHGFYWGGDWQGKKDTMHFSYTER